MSDLEGRYLFLKGDLAGRRVTLASIYLPNQAQLSCLNGILNKLQIFMEGGIILGGDLNVALDPLLDVSKSTTHLSYQYYQKAIQSMRLVDVWRVQHPAQRDYTFYSAPHNSYSRIDY